VSNTGGGNGASKSNTGAGNGASESNTGGGSGGEVGRNTGGGGGESVGNAGGPSEGNTGGGDASVRGLERRALAALAPISRHPVSLFARETAEALPLWMRHNGRGVLGDGPPPVSPEALADAQGGRYTMYI